MGVVAVSEPHSPETSLDLNALPYVTRVLPVAAILIGGLIIFSAQAKLAYAGVVITYIAFNVAFSAFQERIAEPKAKGFEWVRVAFNGGLTVAAPFLLEPTPPVWLLNIVHVFGNSVYIKKRPVRAAQTVAIGAASSLGLMMTGTSMALSCAPLVVLGSIAALMDAVVTFLRRHIDEQFNRAREATQRYLAFGSDVASVNQACEEDGDIGNELLSAMTHGVFVIDWAQRNLAYINERFTKLTGYTSNQLRPLTDHGLTDLVHPDDLTRVQSELQTLKTIDDMEVQQFEARFRTADGRWTWLQIWNVVFERDEHGVPTKTFGSFDDISARKSEEERLQERANSLESANEDLRQFSQIAAHDLQEPLRTLEAFVQMLVESCGEDLDERGRQYVDFILGSTERMSRLVRDLLDHSRLGRDAVVGKVNCQAIVEMVQYDLSSMIAKAEVTFDVGELPIIDGYETELRLLFQNIINNAVKFRRPEQSVHIAITAKKTREGWQFSIADNGIGIEPKHRERIFQLFERLHPKDVYSGTGIGLAHCKKIVELHKGRIWVESGDGTGSRFVFTVAEGL